MPKTETLHIRVTPDLKESVETTLRPLGLSTGEAVTIFLHQVLLHRGLPFPVQTPHYNARTLAAMEEARDIAEGRIPAKSYRSAEEFVEDILHA
jgi:addiction module antitoxin, relB/dinJ family